MAASRASRTWPLGEIDLESYRAEVDKLRSQWKDWEGALQGDGGKDVELGPQVIKKLLSTPVFAHPTEAGPGSGRRSGWIRRSGRRG